MSGKHTGNYLAQSLNWYLLKKKEKKVGAGKQTYKQGTGGMYILALLPLMTSRGS